MVLPAAAAPLPDGFGLNLVGQFSADNGLGNTARAFAAALRSHRVPSAIVNVGGAAGILDTNTDWREHYARSANEIRHPVNLYVVTADFGAVLDRPWLLVPGRLHVATLWWEATSLPPAWIPHLQRLDAIVACTPFVAEIAANQVPLVPVMRCRHPLPLPPGVIADRRRFGMGPNSFVLTTGFNPESDPARKNPLAPIKAFRDAFPRDVADVELVVRVQFADGSGLARRTIGDIGRAIGDDARIRVISEPLSYRDVLSLHASGDAYVSLHRGEGLGLGLMEAMALGKPVIATGWSGNMDFMDYRCACPVRYALAPVRGNYGFLQPEFLGPLAQWATPVMDDAIAWMRRLHRDRDLRRTIGAAAAARIAAYQADAWRRDWIDELAALRQAQRFLPPAAGKYSRPPGQD